MDFCGSNCLKGQVLTGFLADGTPINNQVFIDESATVTLAVPEPATAALVLLGTGVLMCRPYSRAFGNEKAVRPAPRTIR